MSRVFDVGTFLMASLGMLADVVETEENFCVA
jgi:hypothetical protein